MAYYIIKKLKENKEDELLNFLSDTLETKRKVNNKKHQVWELSFNWKHYLSDQFVKQKIDYTHINTCKRKWNLSELPEQYKHSSAKYYLTGVQGFYKVYRVAEMNDNVFLHSVNTIMVDATCGKGRDIAEKYIEWNSKQVNGTIVAIHIPVEG